MFLENPRQGVSKKMAQINLLWWPKNFNLNGHYVEGDRIFFITIQHALTIGWWLKFFDQHRESQLKKNWSPKKGAMSYFLESLQQGLCKNIWHTSFSGNWKVSIIVMLVTKNSAITPKGANQIFSITHPYCDWKFFSHHKGVIKMGQGVSTKNIRPQSYCHYFLDGDWIVSIAIKGVLSYIFGKLLLRVVKRFSKKHAECPLFWWLKNFDCHSKNCDGWMVTIFF